MCQLFVIGIRVKFMRIFFAQQMINLEKEGIQ